MFIKPVLKNCFEGGGNLMNKEKSKETKKELSKDSIIVEKADFLYLIMGTNPFPNIIAAVTRVKQDGNIICICTNETEGMVYDRYKDLIKKKLGDSIEVEKIIVDKSALMDINEKINSNLESRITREKKDISVELNYTGGTKLISSAAYNCVRNFQCANGQNGKISITLSYIDAEREYMYFEKSTGNGDFKNIKVPLKELDGACSLTVSDIISAYNNFDMFNKDEIKTKPEMEKLCQELGNLFVNCDEEQYDKAIDFFEEIYFDYFKKNEKKPFDIFMNDLLDRHKLPLPYKKYEDFGFQDIEKAKEYFKKSIWFEEFIITKFLELKKEGIISDVIANVEKLKKPRELNNKKKPDFEVDIIAYKKYKIYAISVTTIDKPEEARDKLYEIRQRAKNLAGDEAGMCLITLCWDTKELINEYRNIWDDDSIKNTLIVGVNDFPDLKNKLKNWILGVDGNV